MKAFARFSALLLCLAACATEPESVPVYGPGADITPGLNDKEPDTCKVALFSPYIGRPVTEIQAAVGSNPLLVVLPGSLGTQDYDAARINAFVDDNGLVYRLSCG